MSTKVIATKLSFKGDSGASLSGKKKLKRKAEQTEIGTSKHVHPSTEQENEEDIKVLPATGRITSSNTTIYGHNTNFMSELDIGDAIVVIHPTTLQEETKVVRMILSNISMSISSAFSTDLITTTPFQYIKAPKDKEQVLLDEETEKSKKQRKVEQDAFGTYASDGGKQFVYRVKKTGSFGGYKVISETLAENTSREDLLDRRAKKKSDRYCY